MKFKDFFVKTIAVVLATAVAAVCIPTGTVQAATYSIPSSAKIYQDHCYKVYYVKEGIKWDKAKLACEAMGGHLVTITSAGESAFVEKLAKAASKEDEFWIGGTYKGNKWTWITGEKMSYKTPLKSSVSCDRAGYGLALLTYWGKWQGRPSSVNYYICEWDTNTANILPRQVTLSSLKKISSTSVMISWKKVNDAKGYSIYMKTDTKGTYKKIKTISDKNTTFFYQSNLQKGHTYYFKVRAYKNIYGEKCYGELSSEKKISIKK